jgi:hypothetical protein
MGHRARARLANYPGRVAAGAFILNAGIGKLSVDEERATRLHAMAAATYPVLEDLPPERFARYLAWSEVGLGAALLLPAVGDGTAGVALAAFAGGLLGLYVKTPAMRDAGGIRPSQQGTPIAKDVWLLGIGLSLVADSLHHRRRRRAGATAIRLTR